MMISLMDGSEEVINSCNTNSTHGMILYTEDRALKEVRSENENDHSRHNLRSSLRLISADLEPDIHIPSIFRKMVLKPPQEALPYIMIQVKGLRKAGWPILGRDLFKDNGRYEIDREGWEVMLGVIRQAIEASGYDEEEKDELLYAIEIKSNMSIQAFSNWQKCAIAITSPEVLAHYLKRCVEAKQEPSLQVVLEFDFDNFPEPGGIIKNRSGINDELDQKTSEVSSTEKSSNWIPAVMKPEEGELKANEALKNNKDLENFVSILQGLGIGKPENLESPYTLVLGGGEEYTISRRVNRKDFLKEICSPLDEMDELERWYKDLVSHGATYGIFIPPFESIEEDNIMGMMWDQLPSDKQNQKGVMSQLIYRMMRTDGVISKKLTKIRDLMDGVGSNGYALLYNIMRYCHPKLSTRGYSKNAPFQRSNESLAKYVGRTILFYEDEKNLYGRVYSEREQIMKTINQSDIRNRKFLADKAEVFIPEDKQIPRKWKMCFLATTMEEHISKIPRGRISDRRRPPPQDRNKIMYTGEESDEENDRNNDLV